EEKEDFQMHYANASIVMSKVKQIKDRTYFVWILTKDLDSCVENLAAFKEDLFPLVGFYL
ncbi:MAG: hypothetical protein ACTSU5_06795, partial [Promethearchaeota archaeon]